MRSTASTSRTTSSPRSTASRRTAASTSGRPQLEENVAALANLDFSDDEIDEIDRHATDSGINIWSSSSES